MQTLEKELGFSLHASADGWQFEVCSPRKIGEGVNAYISYKVNSTRSSDGTSFSVARRFSDFAWLREQLVRIFPGCIVPSMPPKAIKYTTNTLEEQFVKKRAAGLQSFLVGIVKHAELRDSAHLSSFLEADDYGFAAAKAQTKLGLPNDSTANQMGKWFGWAKQVVKESSAFNSIAVVAGVGVSNAEQVTTAQDAEFKDLLTFVSELEEKMKGLRDRTLELQNMAKWLSEAYRDYGLSILSLGQTDADVLGKALETGSMQKFNESQCSDLMQLCVGFDDQLEEHVLLLSSVRGALRAREDARLGLQSNKENLAALQQKKAQGGFCEPEIDAAKEAVVQHENAFSKVQARCLRDVRQYKKEYQQSLRGMFVQHLQLEQKLLQARGLVLEKTLLAVEASQDVESAPPAPTLAPAHAAPAAAPTSAPAPAPAAPATAPSSSAPAAESNPFLVAASSPVTPPMPQPAAPVPAPAPVPAVETPAPAMPTATAEEPKVEEATAATTEEDGVEEIAL